MTDRRDIEALLARVRALETALKPFAWFGGIVREGALVRGFGGYEADDSPESEFATAGNGAGYQTLRLRHFDAAINVLAADAGGPDA